MPEVGGEADPVAPEERSDPFDGVRLSLLLPSITAAAGLALALSMGELGATITVYPPTWRTLPVTIFTLSDRGDAFLASATIVLVATTSLLLLALGRLRVRR